MLFLFAGLALDGSSLQLERRRVQIAADAAALGAAYERALGKSTWAAAGKSDAALNGFADGSNGVTITIQSPPSGGAFSGDSSAIQVTVTQSVPTMFMALIARPTATVSASAVARPKTGPYCLYAMNSSGARRMMLSGNIQASCAAFVNSSASDALHLDGGSTMNATSIKVVGTYTNSGSISPTPQIGQSAVTDPISTSAPSFSSCTNTNFKMDSSTGSKTLTPGTYCGGISLNGAYTATFQPGLYIITGGANWTNGATVRGNGVTLYFTTGGGSGYGQVVVSGGVTMNLSAPLDSSAGGVPGMLMWGDRNWNSTAQNVNFNGQSVTKMEGVLYFPTTGFILSTGSLASNGNYLELIADNVTVNGGATLTLPAGNYSAVSGGNPIRSGVGLAE